MSSNKRQNLLGTAVETTMRSVVLTTYVVPCDSQVFIATHLVTNGVTANHCLGSLRAKKHG